MALPSERESLNRLVGFAAAANRRRKNQAKTPTSVNSDPSAIQVQSFEEAMNVAMTAIIGGPSHVAKDFSTLQSIAKSKDSIYGIINSQKDVINSINETLSNVSENIKTIADGFQTFDPIVSSWEDFMGTVDEIRDKIVKEKNKGDKVQLIQLAAGDANVGNLLKSLQDFDEKSLEKIEKIVTELNKLNTIDLSKFKENIQVLDDDVIKNLADKFDGIKDLYENHVAGAADAAAKGEKDLETINKTNEKTTEVVVEGKKPDKKQLQEAKTTYEGMASTILAAAFVMIIGALIIKAMPEFPELAMKFAGTLALFTAAVMTPLVLADIIMSKYGGKGAQSFNVIGDIIATAAFVMIIGGLFMKIPEMPEKSLEFTKQLAIFLVLTIGAIGLVSRLAKPELLEQVKGLGNLIVLSAIVMVIGALFMKIDWLPKNALKFGAVLGLFIAVVLGPLMLLSHIGANRKMQNDLKGVSNLIVTCTVVMMIGALFMLLDNGKFVKNALIFGAVLSLFIALVLVPFLILKPLIGMAEHTLKDVTRLIVVCTIIMMVGALFMMLGGGKFVRAALTFAIVLAFFMALCILPILLLKPFIQQGLKMLRDVAIFVIAATIIMLIGAYLILNHPEYIWASLAFGAILALFITATILPVILLGRFTKRALTEIVQIGIFIAICAAVMIVGALFMTAGLGWEAVGFSIVLGIFVLVMAGTMFILSKIPNLEQAVLNAMLLGTAITLLSIAFGIMAFSMYVLSVGDFFKFLLCTTLITAAFAILGIPEVAAFVGLGTIVAAAMGVALTALSIAFMILHVAMLVGDPFEDFTRLGLTLVVAGLVFAALGAMSPLIAFGSIAGTMMGVALTILSGAFVVLHYAMTVSEPWEDFSKLALTLLAAGGVFTLLGVFYPLIVWGSVAGGAMSISLMLLGAAFLVLHETVGTDKVHPWEDFSKLALTLLAAGGVFTLLGLLAPFIFYGSVAGTAMGAALIVIGFAFSKISEMCATYPNAAEDLKSINKVIAIAGLVFTLLGVLSPIIIMGTPAALYMSMGFVALTAAFGAVSYIMQQFPTMTEDLKTIDKAIVIAGLLFLGLGVLSPILIKGSVAAGLMGITMTLLTGVFSLISLLLEEHDVIANTLTMIETVGLMGLLFAGLGLLFPAIIFGGIVMTLMTPLLLGLSYCITQMANATILADAMPDPGKAVGKIGSFFNLIWAFPSGFKVLKMYWRIGTIAPLAIQLSRVLSMMGAAVSGVAALKIPVAWNEKGDPIDYRSLDNNDFTNAAKNVETIITTIGNALGTVYNQHKEMFDDGDDSVIFTVMRASMYMGLVISFIARGLQSYANLLIPDEWNQEGKPIHFTPMDETDFANAAKGISTILSTLGGAILQFIEGNPKLVEYMEETRGGFMGLSKNPSKFATVCVAGKQIGDLIGGIAQGLTAYANMMYPVHWNKDGHPDRFEPMTDTMILQAKVRIVDILTDMTDAISAAYDKINNSGGFFSRIFGSPKKVKEKIECFTSVGDIISGIAEGLSKYAALMIPDQWNKEGKPIHFIKMSDADIMMAKFNIISILKSMATAVSDAYYSIPGSASEIKSRIEAFVPLGDLIGSFATGLQAYAQLLVPTKWDKEGKPVSFEKMSHEDILMAGFNISVVLTTMAAAVAHSYDMFQQGKDADGKPIGMKGGDIEKVVNAFKPMGDLVSGMAQGLQGYAMLMIPDRWNKDGNPIHYSKLPKDFFVKAACNISTVMLLTAWTLQDIYFEHPDLFDGKNSAMNKVIDLGKGIADVISGIAAGLQAYANLLIPTKWNEDGKPIKYEKMTDTDIQNARRNIAWLIVAMADSLVLAYDDPSKIAGIQILSSQKSPVQYLSSSEGQKKLDNIKDLTESIVGLVESICEVVTNISDLKIPTGFNKDGKATGYSQINETSINKMKSNIGMLLVAIPEAVVVNCIEGEHSKWFNGVLKEKEKSIVNTLNSAGRVMDTVLNNVDNLIGEDSTKIIKDVFKYKKQSSLTKMEPYTEMPDIIFDVSAIIKGFILLSTYLKAHFSDPFPSFIFKQAQNLVNTEGKLLRAILTQTDKLNESSELLHKIHSLTIPNAEATNDGILPLFVALNNLISGFGYIHTQIIAEDKLAMTKTYDEKQYVKFGDLLTMIGSTVAKITEQTIAISKNIDNMIAADLSTEKIGHIETVLNNLKTIRLLMSDSLDSKIVVGKETKSVFGFKLWSKDITKTIDNQKILENVIMLSNIIEKFVNTAILAEKIKGTEFENFGNALFDVNYYIKFIDEYAVKKFAKETETTEKFVKAIGSIKINNVMALTRLLEQLTELSQHVGGLDKFTKVLAEQLATTLDQLTKQIRDAQRTIKEADRIQRQRHELIDNSIAKVQKMMESTLQVNVTTTTSGADTSQDVTEEQR